MNDGLPGDRMAWPEGVLVALSAFSQGSVVARPPLFYFANPSLATWARTRDYTDGAEGSNAGLVIEAGPKTQPEYGVITTQTCDVVEEDATTPKRPWVQISPIYDLSDLPLGTRGQLERNEGPAYWFHIPALPDGFWVADLRIEVPVEKGWLSGRVPIDGFENEALQRSLGRRLALIRERPAFAGRFVELVQLPLQAALKDLKRTDKELYIETERSTDHLAVGLDSHLEPAFAKLLVIGRGTMPGQVVSWWSDWWETIVDDAAAHGLTVPPLEFLSPSEITLERWRQFTRLPIHNVSPY